MRTDGHLWLNHVNVWRKPTQHCKAIILQLKIDAFKKPQPADRILQNPLLLLLLLLSRFSRV